MLRAKDTTQVQDEEVRKLVAEKRRSKRNADRVVDPKPFQKRTSTEANLDDDQRQAKRAKI